MIKKWRKQRWLLKDLKTILEIVKPKCGEKLNQHCTSSNVSESFPAHISLGYGLIDPYYEMNQLTI